MAKETVGPRINIFKALLRPNNVTQYTAGDVIDDVTLPAQVVLDNAARFAGGTGRITDALFTTSANKTAVLAGQFEFWLFDTAVAAHEVDNVAFTPTDADMLNLVGVVQFTTVFEATLTADAAGNVAYMAARTFLPIGFQCVALSRDLYGTLVVRNAYTPVANEIFTIRLNVEQD